MPVLWNSHAPLDYPRALALMEARAGSIAQGRCADTLWLLEHPSIYTLGTSANPHDVLTPTFPLYKTGRGGQVTYHGPGQRMAYLMLNLAAHARGQSKAPDLHAYVETLERIIILTLATFGVQGLMRKGRVGVWVLRPDKPPSPQGDGAEDKIAAIGVRVRRGVAFHGFALNVAPNLRHYEAIVPCGIRDAHLGVTSLQDLGISASMADIDRALVAAFEAEFGTLDTALPLAGSLPENPGPAQ